MGRGEIKVNIWELRIQKLSAAWYDKYKTGTFFSIFSFLAGVRQSFLCAVHCPHLIVLKIFYLKWLEFTGIGEINI